MAVLLTVVLTLALLPALPLTAVAAGGQLPDLPIINIEFSVEQVRDCSRSPAYFRNVSAGGKMTLSSFKNPLTDSRVNVPVAANPLGYFKLSWAADATVENPFFRIDFYADGLPGGSMVVSPKARIDCIFAEGFLLISVSGDIGTVFFYDKPVFTSIAVTPTEPDIIEMTPSACDSHTPGSSATCTTAQTCTRCGEELDLAVGHSWVSNDDGTHDCTNGCGETNETCSPSDPGEVCAKCGYVTPGESTPEPSPTPEPTPEPSPTPEPPSKPSYTVTFDTNGGTEIAPMTDVAHDITICAPATKKEGYSFVAWFKDAALTDVWNFGSNTVTADITLYAKWKEELVFDPRPDDPADDRFSGIDYDYPDIIVPGSIDGYEMANEYHINLRSEIIVLPEDFIIKEYSLDGGFKWQKVKQTTFKNFDAKKGFPKLLDKGMTLHIKNADGVIVTFPQINKRPKAPYALINYTLAADWSGKTAGEWMLNQKSDKEGTTPYNAGIEIAVSARDPKEISKRGFGKFYCRCVHDGNAGCIERSGAKTPLSYCADIPGQRIGIPVESSPGGKVVVFYYYVRTAPEKLSDTEYTAASKPKKVRAKMIHRASVKSMGKPPNYSIKSGKIRLKNGDMLFAGGSEDLGISPTEVSGNITLEAGQLIYNKSGKVVVVALDDYKGKLTAWKAPNKKAVSQRQKVR